MATKSNSTAKAPPRKQSAKKRRTGKRAQNKEAIRKRIVKSALHLFQTKGFDTTTTKAIARKAGIAEGTVFNYFRTKEDIALSFFEEEVDHAIAAVRDNPRLRKAPLEEKLFTLVHSQLEYLAPYERFIGAALIHALNPASHLGAFSHRAQQLRHRYLAFVTELVEESSPKQQRDALSWLVPEAFWIYYLGVLLFWLYDSSKDKEHTIAFLDRSLHVGVAFLTNGRR
ncbi:MAG: TetR/AcrR family transcriptional regulator [Acidobacteria bacterium]|nr:TetR/AcrR family transcriptional regulator [Acidobacteriota bacterium]MCA1627675.1 TetR/AcrR family transcriptional regulator [Acidobacteriota bacterium]